MLTIIPGLTSPNFLVGQGVRKDETQSINEFVIIFLDFADLHSRKYKAGDFKQWYTRPVQSKSLMGHKQWDKWSKVNTDCYVGKTFSELIEQEENCACVDSGYVLGLASGNPN
ncbi:hypothetical protein IW261DRAFT_1577700 [Armillaria novae-zelandiae]|uniref:Sortilin C-terminal domain-containing protein n=1 Tax=Armillaria novae-zelandiae TaxID=153914 RepID=A0AA39KJ38_9AGAR|nr:hypothetical protein IW261DRAFT_1577700 [Armillaria novae-zelandiae]